MGPVSREHYNVRIMNKADYSDDVSLKNLLKNYNNLHELASLGDSECADIYVDLKTAFETSKMTAKQKRVMELYYIDAYEMPEIAEMYGVTKSSIRDRLQEGFAKIKKVLTSGDDNGK